MNTRQENILLYKLGFLFLATMLCTYLRISLLLIYPLLIVGIYYALRWKLHKNAIYIFIWMAFCLLLSFRHGWYMKYHLLSLYYLIPFLLLLFAVPPRYETKGNYLQFFMNALAAVMIVNDIVGIIQYIVHPNDDQFIGIYGIFTVSQNGLSLVNGLLFFYHLSLYQRTGRIWSLVTACFFILCCVMGFYGAGQLVLIAAVMLTYFRIKLKNILQLVLITLVTLASVVILMKTISPKTFDYNVAIIKKFTSPSVRDYPRKMIIFKNYFDTYGQNPVDLLFGSGPGTFNSRSAFMVGSPYYFNVPAIKSDAKPYYFQHYAYTLWNNTNTGPYDGFMNQPFTNILALAGEYGLLFCILLFIPLMVRFRRVNKLAYQQASITGVTVEAKMYRFTFIFATLLIIIDNYMEYPEIIALLLLTLKLSEQRLKNALNV